MSARRPKGVNRSKWFHTPRAERANRLRAADKLWAMLRESVDRSWASWTKTIRTGLFEGDMHA